MAVLDQLNELNAKQRLLIVGVVIGLMAVIFYYYIFTPNTRTIANFDSQLTALETELKGLRAIEMKLPEFKAETLRLQNQLSEIRRKLPQEKEIPGLLENISRAGMESGLQFELFRPGSEVKKEIYSEVPVDISVRGPFQSMAMFIDKISHFPRIVNVTRFNFSAPKEEGNFVFISGTGVATTYRYNEKN
jgi:type IV pilus assembly protein PilO